ncbi:MAG: hypothetical protein HY401_10240 [Elusimicrobia bacterium]|nr:hypothetical protein [Elusimicrobiota bacterium]
MPKKKESAENNKEDSFSYERLVLDYPTTRYPVIRLAADWALVLKRKQEFQHLKKNEILEKALADVLSEKVDKATVAKELEASLKALENNGADAVEETKAKLKLKIEEKPEKETPKKKEKEKAKA